MYLDELTHFLDCVNGQSEILVDIEEGIRSLEISLAARESMISGKPIRLEKG